MWLVKRVSGGVYLKTKRRLGPFHKYPNKCGALFEILKSLKIKLDGTVPIRRKAGHGWNSEFEIKTLERIEEIDEANREKRWKQDWVTCQIQKWWTFCGNENWIR